MSDIIGIDLIGLILPPFIDLINTRITNAKVRYAVSLLVAVLVAGVIKFFGGELSWNNAGSMFASAGIIFAYAQTVYKLYWEKSATRATLIK